MPSRNDGSHANAATTWGIEALLLALYNSEFLLSLTPLCFQVYVPFQHLRIYPCLKLRD